MSQFGIQMYTLRETMKTPEDYETTLRRVAEMGYTNVQLTPPAFSGAEDTQRLLEKYGLAADSAICGVYQIPERLDQIEKDAKTLKTDVVRTDSIRPEDRGDTEGYKRFAAHLNLCGAELKRRGLKFMYHFHSFEFVKLGDVRGIDILLGGDRPRNRAVPAGRVLADRRGHRAKPLTGNVPGPRPVYASEGLRDRSARLRCAGGD